MFQGRYRAILAEDISTLGRVVDYVHLNPVRAKVMVAEQIGQYRWSSLAAILRGEEWIDGDGWQGTGGFGNDAPARKAYEKRLIEIGQNERLWREMGLEGLSQGWALGTSGWRRAVARDYGHMALNPGSEQAEIRELREGAWERAVEQALRASGKREDELPVKPWRQDWKVAVARRVREETGALVVWLAQRLHLGAPASLRSYLSRTDDHENQQTTA